MVCYVVEYETMQLNFSYSVTLKSIFYLNDRFTHARFFFLTSNIGYWGNMDSLSYTLFQMLAHLSLQF